MVTESHMEIMAYNKHGSCMIKTKILLLMEKETYV